MTKQLSPTQAQILTAAAQHPERLAEVPPNLPVAARNAVFQSMLRPGLLEEVPGAEGNVFRITAAGLAAVVDAADAAEEAGEAAADAQEGRRGPLARSAAPEARKPPAAPAGPSRPRITLRAAATALLVAWDAGLERSALPMAMEALRAALTRGGATRPPRDPSAPDRPRERTKQQAVLALLRREEGTTITQIMDATGWAQHTVRGFLAGLKKKGHRVEVLERVRQVGPGAQGAKGSFSVYRIAPATAGEGQG